MDPRSVDAIWSMHSPVTAGELCQFIHCSWWTANSIPAFHQRIEELSDILESDKEKAENAKIWLKEYPASQPLLEDGTRKKFKTFSRNPTIRGEVSFL